MKLAIVGDGRMARAIAGECAVAGDEVVAMIGAAENPGGQGITPAALRGAEVVLEFTVPTAAAANLRALNRIGARVVCGTTGWDAERATIEAEFRAGQGALLAASNFALGVHFFLRTASALAAAAARQPGFAGFIHERHHAAKLDAPSGTALTLQHAVVHADPSREWPITSVRAGSIPGEHEVVLDAAYESITLRHVVRDRRVFAAGALTAAHWLRGRQGVYAIDAIFQGE